MEGMLGYLGFELNKKRLEGVISGNTRNAFFNSLDDILARKSSIDYDAIIQREIFASDKLMVVASTRYPNLDELLRDSYKSRSVVMNYRMGLKNKVISPDQARGMFPLEKSPHAHALQMGYIVKANNLYSVHPRLIYNVCLKKAEK